MSKYAVCDVQELPEGSHILRMVADRVSVGIYHLDGRIVAFRNYCPHAGAPVCEGLLGSAILSTDGFERHLAYEGRILRCPWHAWEFLLPEGVTLTNPPYRLMSLPTVIEEGKVMVELDAVAGTNTQDNA